VSLQTWLRNGWVISHKPTRREIRDLLALVDRDLEACQTPNLSVDWRFNIAYSAALQAATAALAAAGYRAAREAHHLRVIQSLAFSIGADSRFVQEFDAFRKKRNLTSYEFGGRISNQEAEEMATLARGLNQSESGLRRTIRSLGSAALRAGVYSSSATGSLGTRLITPRSDREVMEMPGRPSAGSYNFSVLRCRGIKRTGPNRPEGGIVFGGISP
jgi:hypothetical protein